MKHVKSLSNEKPMMAQEAAWWTGGNFLKLWPGPILTAIGTAMGAAANPGAWFAQLLDDFLQS